MFFILRALFWTAVVAAFVPAGFTAAENGVFAREARALFQAPAENSFASAQHHSAEFCGEQSEACAVMDQFSRYGAFLTELAVHKADQVLEDRLAGHPDAPSNLDELLMSVEVVESTLP